MGSDTGVVVQRTVRVISSVDGGFPINTTDLFNAGSHRFFITFKAASSARVGRFINVALY